MKAYMQMLPHLSPYAPQPDISCLEPKSLGKSAHFAKKCSCRRLDCIPSILPSWRSPAVASACQTTLSAKFGARFSLSAFFMKSAIRVLRLLVQRLISLVFSFLLYVFIVLGWRCAL